MKFTFDHTQEDYLKALGITEEDLVVLTQVALCMFEIPRSKRIESLMRFSKEEIALYADVLLQMHLQNNDKDSSRKDKEPSTNLFKYS